MATRNTPIRQRATSADITIATVTGVPAEMQPGRFTANATIDVHPDALSRVTDPDHCDLGLFQVGFRVEMQLVIDGTVADSTVACIGNDTTIPFNINLQTQGGHTVEFVLLGANSRNRLDRQSFTVFVTETGNGGGGGTIGEPGGDTNGNGGGLGPLVPCFIDPNRSCGRFEGIAWGALAILALIQVVGMGE